MSTSRGSGAAGNGGGVRSIPAGSRKRVQSLKEIVNCTEAEIYATLKDCNMDHNEAINRLLSQDPFHEVKSKREKKKEGKDTTEPRSHGANNNSSRSGKTGGDRYLGRGSSTPYYSSESDLLPGNSIYKKENGSTPYASSLSSGPAMSGSSVSAGFSNGATAENKGYSFGAADATPSGVQPGSGYQSAWVGAPGQVFMADIVKMGRPHNKASNVPNASHYSGQGPSTNTSHNNLRFPEDPELGTSSAQQIPINEEWPIMPPATKVVSIPYYPVDSEQHLGASDIPSDGVNQLSEAEEVQEEDDDNIENSVANAVESDSISSRKLPEDNSRCASLYENDLYKDMDSYQHQGLHDFHEGSDDLYMPQLDTEDSDDGSRSSCEYQACNVSDFYISDMIFTGTPSGSNSQFDNKTDTIFLPDYKFEESSLLCDISEEYMALPFLEENLDVGHDFDGRPQQETIDAENSSLYMAIHQLKSCNNDSQINTYTDPDYECFDPQMYIRSFPDQPDVSFTLLPTSVSNEKQSKEITLVLDLDETLVHSTLEHCDDADFTFSVFFNMKEHTVYVKQRPHLQTFLKRVAKLFEIVVFTASQSIYAEQLLDILDPDGNLISRRAYRESCIFSEGCYVKDLTVLGVNLAKVAIIDNSPQVFRLQVNNGIPIKSWFDDPSDCALISMLPFLESLVDADDVRPIIARKFGNKE